MCLRCAFAHDCLGAYTGKAVCTRTYAPPAGALGATGGYARHVGMRAAAAPAVRIRTPSLCGDIESKIDIGVILVTEKKATFCHQAR